MFAPNVHFTGFPAVSLATKIGGQGQIKRDEQRSGAIARIQVKSGHIFG